MWAGSLVPPPDDYSGKVIQKGIENVSGKKITVIVFGVALLAGVVIGGVLWMNSSKNATEGVSIPTVATTTPAAGVEEERDGVVVIMGKPEATTSIDVYVDFLCPACGDFQKQFGEAIEQQVNVGTLQVRYRLVPLLNSRSDPEGYSLDAANAALAAADAGKFIGYHHSLFAKQPEEGKRGYDKAQLIKLGKDLGITDPRFAETINTGRYNEQLTTEFEQTLKDTNLQQDFGQGPGFGTPMVVSKGKVVPLTDGWLPQLLGSGPA